MSMYLNPDYVESEAFIIAILVNVLLNVVAVEISCVKKNGFMALSGILHLYRADR